MADRFQLPFAKEQAPGFDQYMDQEAVVSGSEATGAAFDLAMEDTGVMLWARNRALGELESSGVKRISADEANKRYPGMPTPFREDVNPFVAQHLYDRHQERMELQRKVQLGPSDNWSKTKQFGAGLLAHLMDPLEFGVGQVVGLGVGGLIARGSFGTAAQTAAQSARAGTAGFATRAALEVAESGAGNLVENVIQEGATAPTVIREGGQYDPVVGMQNVAISTFGGTLGISGAKLAVKGLFGGGARLWRALRDTSPEADLAVMRTATSQMAQDIRPNVEPIVNALAKETDVNAQMHPGKFSYNYEPLTPRSGGKDFYVVTRGEFGSERVAVGDRYLGGIQATDNSGIANASAARAMGDADSAVWKVRAGELNTLDLNAPIPENARGSFEGVLNEIGEKVDFENTSGKDILDSIMVAIDEGDLDASKLENITQGLKDQGFNSWVHDGSRRLGYQHEPHNVLEVFDDSVMEPQGRFSPDPQVRADPTQEQVDFSEQYGQGIKNRLDVDSDRFDQFHKEIRENDTKITQAAAEAPERTKALLEEFDALEKQGLLDDPGMLKELEVLKKMQADFEVEDLATKAMVYCVGG